MRWERLFADLEGRADDDALLERDALIADLREGEWAATPWWRLCGGAAELDVVGLGRVAGRVVSANAYVLQVRTEAAHVLVNARQVVGVRAERRADAPGAVAARLGLAYALRMCQRDRERVRVHRLDGTVCAGFVERVGRDFVDLREDTGRHVIVPLAAVAAVSCPL